MHSSDSASVYLQTIQAKLLSRVMVASKVREFIRVS